VELQEEGLDTVDANRALGLPDDCREYSSVKNILNDLGIKSIRLMVCLTASWCMRHVYAVTDLSLCTIQATHALRCVQPPMSKASGASLFC